MKPHRIRLNHKTETPSRIIFFDSESWVKTKIVDDDLKRIEYGERVTKEHQLYLICACFCDRKKERFIERWRDYTEGDIKEQFWGEVDQYAKKGTKTYIFAHNAKYDILVTGGVHYLVKLGYVVKSFSDSNPFFLNLVKYTEETKNLDDEEKRKVEKSINILSSTNYYQFSLAKLGECFKIPKMEVDYETCTIEESLPYCRNDVLILKTAMLGFIQFVRTEDLGNFKMTIAGQAFNAFRHRFMKTDIFVHRDKKALILEREAYAGGRNEVWKKGKFTEPIFYVDVNSMYPYVMKELEYPVRMITTRKRVDIDELQNFIDDGYLVVAKVELNTKKRIYFKKEGKLIFPTGNFTTTLNTPEIQRALADNEIVKVLETTIYEKANIFAEYVDYFYNKRLEAKANGDEVRTLLYKIFLNSLYGKFGQKSNGWDKIGEAPPDMIKEEKIYDDETGECYTVKVFGGAVFRNFQLPEGESEAFNSFPAVASHVTGYARMLLWSYIETAGLETVYYMDTDSLFVNREGYQRLEAQGCLDENILGKLKLEHEIFETDIRGCKDYKIKYKKKDNIIEENKIKGVTKSSLKLNEKEYASIVWKGFSKGIKSGNLNGYENEVMIKNLKREYTKGLIQENNILPFDYSNNENVAVNKKIDLIQSLKNKISELNLEKENNKKEISQLKQQVKELQNKNEFIIKAN